MCVQIAATWEGIQAARVRVTLCLKKLIVLITCLGRTLLVHADIRGKIRNPHKPHAHLLARPGARLCHFFRVRSVSCSSKCFSWLTRAPVLSPCDRPSPARRRARRSSPPSSGGSWTGATVSHHKCPRVPLCPLLSPRASLRTPGTAAHAEPLLTPSPSSPTPPFRRQQVRRPRARPRLLPPGGPRRPRRDPHLRHPEGPRPRPRQDGGDGRVVPQRRRGAPGGSAEGILLRC